MPSAPVPRVSVIVPARNAEHWLGEALASALSQHDIPLEIVVVDDASTDGTVALAEQHGAPVRCLRQATPRGAAAARNVAIAHARGELIAFLDADDRFLPGKLARQVAFLDAHPELGLVHTGWDFVDELGRCIGTGWSPLEGDVAQALLSGESIHPLAAVMRRAPVVALGAFDETLPALEDWDLFLRLALRGMHWGRIPEPLCEYRVHPDQSHRRAALKHATRLHILARTFDDPAFPPALVGSRGEVFQRAYLRATAELLDAGLPADAQRAFVEAVRARPGVLAEPGVYRSLARLLMPTGRQSQAHAAREWLAVTRTLGSLVEHAVREAEMSTRLRWAARWNVLRTGARLLRKRVGAATGVTAPRKVSSASSRL
jgi:GT2 family glycosyltransferase